MATKKFLEYQEMSIEDLQNELNEVQAQHSKLQFDHAVNGIENPLLIREMRREVARLKTEMRRREIAAMSADDLAGRDKIRARRRKK